MQYRFTLTVADTTVSATFDRDGPVVIFTGLSPATSYDVYVQGLNATTLSKPSNSLLFTTPAGGSPDVAAQETGTSSGVARISGPAGVWQRYDVTICPVGYTLCQTAPCTKAATDPTTCQLTGLSPGISYVVTVRRCRLPAACLLSSWGA